MNSTRPDFGRRVELTTSRPTVLFILAKRTEIVLIFRTLPKQSDYARPCGENAEGEAVTALLPAPTVESNIRGMARGGYSPVTTCQAESLDLRKFRKLVARRKFNQLARHRCLENRLLFSKGLHERVEPPRDDHRHPGGLGRGVRRGEPPWVSHRVLAMALGSYTTFAAGLGVDKPVFFEISGKGGQSFRAPLPFT